MCVCVCVRLRVYIAGEKKTKKTKDLCECKVLAAQPLNADLPLLDSLIFGFLPLAARIGV